MGKKKIVVLIDWYLPGYKAGGPIQSVANIISRLKNDFEFAVITSCCDLDGSPYDEVPMDQWTVAPDGTRTYYISKKREGFRTLKKLLLDEQADELYMNSLFSVQYTLLPLLVRKLYLPSRKTVLAPRGMLGKGALDIKPFRKKIFLLTSRMLGLFRHVTWHASTELESQEIKKHFGINAVVLVAGNLTSLRTVSENKKSKAAGKASFVFLSRIASKKNLLPFIRCLQRLPADTCATFDIYGPVDENDYWQECLKLISKTPAHISINYHGPVENSRVPEVLSRYQFSVLYTLHENFGHSIIEGMTAGCPVIISDQTPWRNLQAVNAGWDVKINDAEALCRIVEYCCKMNGAEYEKWSNGAITFASKVIENESVVEANRKLFI